MRSERNDKDNNDTNGTPPCTRRRSPCVVGQKKPITRPYVRDVRLPGAASVEPKTADSNKLAWRPAEHRRRTALGRDWSFTPRPDRNAAVRKRIQPGLCGYAEAVITMKTGYKRKYTKNTDTYIVRTIYKEPHYQRLNYIRLLSKSQVLRKHDLRHIGLIKNKQTL